MVRMPRPVAVALIGISVVGLAAFGLLYGTGGGLSNRGDPACAAAKPLTERLKPLARGEVAAFRVASHPAKLPNVNFVGPDGQPASLESFRGRTILLNLWATWCAPCRKEMPALDQLQAALGGPNFEVVAVNIDTRNLDKPKTWLQEAGVTRLVHYNDPQAKIFQDLKAIGKAVGMPTTLLIDNQGCELGLLSGPAEWASQDAIALIGAALVGP